MYKHTMAQFHDFSSVSAASSYALGPVDPSHLVPVVVLLSSGSEVRSLVPDETLLSVTFLSDPLFCHGLVTGYESPSEMNDAASIPDLLNEIYHCFEWDLTHGDDLAQVVGYVLGSLSFLAPTELLFALVGISYLCWLLPLFAPYVATGQRRYLSEVCRQHRCLVNAYRLKVRALKLTGLSYEQAQRQSLDGFLPHLSDPSLDLYCARCWADGEQEEAEEVA
jgi:hypothetical protein